MYPFAYLLLLLLSASSLTAQPSYSALHQRLFNGPANHVYDRPAWIAEAKGPIRSTPLAVIGRIYVGTTMGEVICLNQNDGRMIWRMHTGYPVNASPAYHNGIIYVADGEQRLYALRAADGKLMWQYRMGARKPYPWRFDYFYSSPVIDMGVVYIGSDDGYLHALSASTGALIWKQAARTIIRSSPVLLKDLVLYGDMDGRLVALNKKTGQPQWTFSTIGDTLRNEDWGFDRKAILSSPVVVNNRILFGCRDGFFYCIDDKGRQLWRGDHQVSWVISTLAVKDSIVVTGTSDGRFVQAVHLDNGKEIWKFRPNALFWSSAAIVNEQVYIGSFDGVLYALDLRTGVRQSQFNTDDKILSSAVFANGKLFFGCDNGKLYALQGHADQQLTQQKRFVYYEAGVNNYFRHGADLRIKNYLTAHHYKWIGPDTIAKVMQDASNTVIVFASNYIPSQVTHGAAQSHLRRFLDGGGRVVFLGLNPLVYRYDAATKQAIGFDLPKADSVLDLQFGPNDTRGMGGQFTSRANANGALLNLPPYWVSAAFLPVTDVQTVLGVNENGDVSAYVKAYRNGGRLVQLFLHPDLPTHLDAVLKAAEWRLDAAQLSPQQTKGDRHLQKVNSK